MSATRLERGMAWVDANLGRFVRRAGGLEAPSLKALGELGHLCEILVRAPATAGRARAWAAHGWRELGEGRVFGELVARTPKLATAALVLAPYLRLGHDHGEGLRGEIASVLARAPLDPREWAFVVPGMAALGLPIEPELAALAARGSVLVAAPPPERLPLALVYQLTHEVFYACDWGARPDGVRRFAPYLAAIVPRLLGWATAGRDTDLAAELLACERCLGRPGEAAAWALLDEAQGDDGSIAGPPGRATTQVAWPADEAEFGARHHPTLVTLMAWGLRAAQ
jgi:hypothetical protein